MAAIDYEEPVTGSSGFSFRRFVYICQFRQGKDRSGPSRNERDLTKRTCSGFQASVLPGGRASDNALKTASLVLPREFCSAGSFIRGEIRHAVGITCIHSVIGQEEDSL